MENSIAASLFIQASFGALSHSREEFGRPGAHPILIQVGLKVFGSESHSKLCGVLGASLSFSGYVWPKRVARIVPAPLRQAPRKDFRDFAQGGSRIKLPLMPKGAMARPISGIRRGRMSRPKERSRLL
jgi:hypothetical protein